MNDANSDHTDDCPISPGFESFSWADPVDHDNRRIEDTPITCPFTIVIDTREQAPWSFIGIKTDSDKKYRPMIVCTTRMKLDSGDYSISGYENQISIERKSLSDAFGTFTVDRERFERELERLNAMKYAAVVIEGDWSGIAAGPERSTRSELHRGVIGKTCLRSICAWSQRFPNVHWWALPTRLWAERWAFRQLERFWLDRQWEKKQAAKSAQGKIEWH